MSDTATPAHAADMLAAVTFATNGEAAALVTHARAVGLVAADTFGGGRFVLTLDTDTAVTVADDIATHDGIRAVTLPAGHWAFLTFGNIAYAWQSPFPTHAAALDWSCRLTAW